MPSRRPACEGEGGGGGGVFSCTLGGTQGEERIGRSRELREGAQLNHCACVLRVLPLGCAR